jgi:hypothetical protein
MPLPVLSGTTDAEDDVPGPGVDIFLKLLDAVLDRAQQAILSDYVQELASI